eukprot:365870-Chlamydomonas_euryale.AAC.10
MPPRKHTRCYRALTSALEENAVVSGVGSALLLGGESIHLRGSACGERQTAHRGHGRNRLAQHLRLSGRRQVATAPSTPTQTIATSSRPNRSERTRGAATVRSALRTAKAILNVLVAKKVPTSPRTRRLAPESCAPLGAHIPTLSQRLSAESATLAIPSVM